ncbi:MAG: hypothetical protein RXP89_04525 [Nitrososphaeria archaeon]
MSGPGLSGSRTGPSLLSAEASMSRTLRAGSLYSRESPSAIALRPARSPSQKSFESLALSRASLSTCLCLSAASLISRRSASSSGSSSLGLTLGLTALPLPPRSRSRYSPW